MGYGQYSIYGGERRSNPLRYETPMTVQGKTGKPKRKREVFPTDEIPHLWAHQTQERARNPQGNLYFNGNVIYSYRDSFPIGIIVTKGEGKKQKRAFIITTDTYSVTTAGHVYAASRAVPSNELKFQFDLQGREEINPEAAIRDYVSRIETAISKRDKAKSARQMRYANSEAESLLAEVRKFARFFGVKTGKLPKLIALPEEKLQKGRMFDAQISDRREARYRARAERWRKREEEQERQAKEEMEKLPELLERWRAGENISFSWRVRDKIPTMLRIQGDEVQTSLGARVPVSHAIRGLKFVKGVMAKGEEYVRNGHTIHLGHYPIDRITKEGTLHAGCHVIPWDEIQKIAPELDAIKSSDKETEESNELSA